MSWSPTTAPHSDFETVYLVMDSFGAHGTAYRETDIKRADLETVIADLMAGEFNAPVRVDRLQHAWALGRRCLAADR